MSYYTPSGAPVSLARGASGAIRSEFVAVQAGIDIFAAAVPALVAAAVAVGGSLTNSTSTTSLSIGTGTKSLTIETGKSITIGMNLLVASTASPTNWMAGPVTAYNSTTGAITFTSTNYGGTGSFSAWTTSITGILTAAGTIPIGCMVAGADVGTTFTNAGATYLKTGIATTAATYPGAPATTLNDAATWVARTSASASAWVKTAYGAGIFVAVQSGAAATAYQTSPDGVTWTARAFPVSGTWKDVAFGNGVFLVVDSTNSATVFLTSIDGITWTQRTVAANATGYQAIAYGSSGFVISSGNTTGLQTLDGITYNSSAFPSLANWKCIAYGNGFYLALVTGATTAATSIDGITWIARTLPGTSSAPANSLAFGNGIFVIATGGGLYSSKDGATWNVTVNPLGNSTTVISYGNGIFVASSATASATIYSSSDGVTWTARTISSSAAWSVIGFGSNTFVALVASSTSASSSTSSLSYVDSLRPLFADSPANTRPFYMRVT